ncbi:MAG: hypothetical protein NTZ48_00140 [Candidatus Omnitrophica bacterium]|nr:hypothetical protein [Candidatus Omnitrophota bacterium]
MSQRSEYKMHPLRLGNRTSFLVLSCLSVMAVLLQPAFCQSNDTMKGMDMGGQTQDTIKSAAPDQAKMNIGEEEIDMVHPFFTHMGLPDPVGHYALRMSGVAIREEGRTRGDFGFHLETGLARRLGLHIRDDRVSNNAHTEIMFQYAAIQSLDGMSGFSPFVEVEIPTHKDERHTYGLVGFSTMWSTHILELNQSLEYSPKEEALEGSVSLVGKVGQRLFPVVEFILAADKDAKPQNSMIWGLKYRVNRHTVLGIGYQVPVTESKEFAHQVLLQTDIEW